MTPPKRITSARETFMACPECGRLAERAYVPDPESPTELILAYLCEGTQRHVTYVRLPSEEPKTDESH